MFSYLSEIVKTVCTSLSGLVGYHVVFGLFGANKQGVEILVMFGPAISIPAFISRESLAGKYE